MEALIMTHSPRISFKRGDSFRLDLTVTDPNSASALAAAEALATAEANYAAALAADPVVPQDVIDTLALVVSTQATYDAAIIVDITAWTITSSLRWCGKLITDFTITIVNAAIGTLNITAITTVTELWQVREHQMDILFVRSEGTTSSETIWVDVKRGSTNG